MNSQTAKDSDRALLKAAAEIRKRAHAPYSEFRVGAAVIDENGNQHLGCNVENAAYPEGICAETNAIGAMVVAGGTRIVAIATVGGHDELTSCTPCGGCRQRIAEFSDADTRVILADGEQEVRCVSIDELLPDAFSEAALPS